MVLIEVVHGPGYGWRGACSVHGELPVVWDSPLFAAMDVLGHTAHHHRRCHVAAAGT